MVTRGKAIEPTDWAYLAGIIDGEGHIGIVKNTRNPQRRHSPRYQVELVVVNSYRPLIDWLVENFGGSVYTRKKLLEHHKQTWRWKVGDTQAAIVCAGAFPYLRQRRQHAVLLAEFIEQRLWAQLGKGSGRRVPDDELDRREVIYQQFKVLTDDRRPQRLSERAPQPVED